MRNNRIVAKSSITVLAVRNATDAAKARGVYLEHRDTDVGAQRWHLEKALGVDAFNVLTRTPEELGHATSVGRLFVILSDRVLSLADFRQSRRRLPMPA